MKTKECMNERKVVFLILFIYLVFRISSKTFTYLSNFYLCYCSPKTDAHILVMEI